jgi:hypothetical protein
MEESIYNIIPKEYKPDPKPPLYRSKYPPNIPPTGSTFCHQTTSKPGVTKHLFRYQIFQGNSLWAFKLIPNMAISQLLVTSRWTGNRLLKISGKKILVQWGITLFHQSETFRMIALIRSSQYLRLPKSLFSA